MMLCSVDLLLTAAFSLEEVSLGSLILKQGDYFYYSTVEKREYYVFIDNVILCNMCKFL